jgi:hypothetical protein
MRDYSEAELKQILDSVNEARFNMGSEKQMHEPQALNPSRIVRITSASAANAKSARPKT